MSERIVIAGANGFIGRHLTNAFVQAGFNVLPLNRSGVDGVKWDGKSQGEWVRSLEGAKAVINLAGAPINGRWTDAYRQELIDSRVQPTLALAEAIRGLDQPPEVWVNGSAVGYYGDAVFDPVDESGPAGKDFLADVCVAWERAALDSGVPTQVKIIRTGFVLGNDGGAFPILHKLTKSFLGGAVGNGKQVMAWIHIEDLCRMFVSAVTREDWPTIVNGTAPNLVTNSDFMSVLRRAIGRPWVPGPPAFVMKAVTDVTRQSAPVLALASQNALPKAALDVHFPFEFPLLEGAIKNLLRS